MLHLSYAQRRNLMPNSRRQFANLKLSLTPDRRANKISGDCRRRDHLHSFSGTRETCNMSGYKAEVWPETCKPWSTVTAAQGCKRKPAVNARHGATAEAWHFECFSVVPWPFSPLSQLCSGGIQALNEKLGKIKGVDEGTLKYIVFPHSIKSPLGKERRLKISR